MAAPVLAAGRNAAPRRRSEDHGLTDPAATGEVPRAVPGSAHDRAMGGKRLSTSPPVVCHRGRDDPSGEWEPAGGAGPTLDVGPRPDPDAADDGDGGGEVRVASHEVVHRGHMSEVETIGDLTGTDQIVGVHLSAHRRTVDPTY